MNELVAQTCEECGADRLQLQNEVRQLREKLEYSQLQNSILNSQCNLLRKKLCEAEFRGRSSVAVFSPPSLPNEVLRHVFSLATKLDCLVSPRWDNKVEAAWEASSLARRAIPLVCRTWYRVGLDFLYEHVILRSVSQISQFLEASKHLGPLTRGRHLGCIRGLEFVMQEEEIEEEEANAFKELACRLVRMLPAGQLRSFAVDCGECHGSRTKKIGSIVVEALQKSCETLEVLHLPCVAHADSSWSTQGPLHRALSTSALKLHTLSLTGGTWNSCTGFTEIGTDRFILTALEKAAGSIRSLLINCSSFSAAHDQQIRHFLAHAVHLDTVHVVASDRSNLLVQDLDEFLEEAPALRHLLITPSARYQLWRFGTPEPVTDVFVHHNLENITVYMNTPISHSFIFMLQPLMLKVKSGNLPYLQRIILHGNFPEGCLDGYQLFSPDVFKLWEDAIDWCVRQNVEMVSHLGYPIHLWRVRHSIRLESSSGGVTTGSDEGEWFELGGSGGTSALGEAEVGSEGNVISDDPEDTLYRYVHQRDIEQVDPDSDDEEWL